jgi:citrate lyase beta subunit
MKTTLNDSNSASILHKLSRANAEFAAVYPGDSADRQPVHTVYGGAHLFRSDSAAALGRKALVALRQYAPDGAVLAAATGLPASIGAAVYDRVVAKLEREPVEDFRIDFEDGYGNRPDPEEDAEAERTAGEVARGMENGSLPPFIGIRIKPFTEVLRARSMRTLDIFLSTLLDRTGGRLPAGFVVTLPKIQVPEQVAALADLFDVFEAQHGLHAVSLRMEFMIETPQSIIDARGEFALPALVAAARGRCRGAHFGTYDYTALCNITAVHQHMLHPACDYARQAMLVCMAQRGIFLSDGATNIMPISRDGDIGAIHRAWRLHVEHIRNSLVNAFYQGWDLHPAQLPTRYAAVYSFFLEGLDAATARLKNFIERAAQATLVGDVFDDAATGQGLLNYFLRGLGCGALTEGEVLATGLTLAELRTRSFLKILEGRVAHPERTRTPGFS